MKNYIIIGSDFEQKTTAKTAKAACEQVVKCNLLDSTKDAFSDFKVMRISANGTKFKGSVTKYFSIKKS